MTCKTCDKNITTDEDREQWHIEGKCIDCSEFIEDVDIIRCIVCGQPVEYPESFTKGDEFCNKCLKDSHDELRDNKDNHYE